MSSVSSSKRFSFRPRTRGDFRNEKIDDDDNNNNITYIYDTSKHTESVVFAAGPVVLKRCVGVWGFGGLDDNEICRRFTGFSHLYVCKLTMIIIIMCEIQIVCVRRVLYMHRKYDG